MIAKVDRYLAGWKATLLSPAGRVVLINAVLDGLPTYAMGALLLSVGVKEVLDAKRRAFLWNGSGKTTGAKCLVAWENFCKAKEDRGSGIRRLDTQNACLMIKMIHQLHHPGDSSWAAWARNQVRLLDLHGDVTSPHWEAMIELLLGSDERITTGIQKHITCQAGGRREHILLV